MKYVDLTNNDDYIRTYVYHWYDDAHRLTDTANYGTYNADGWKDNSSAPTYGASAPSRSDTVLVTTYAYNSAGRRCQTTDPKAVVAELTFDDLGRTIQKIEDKGTGGALNRFNGMGRMVRRVHEEDSGMYGNDTKLDLWHGVSGQYDGLDRFGRIADLKLTEFSGTPVDFDTREYTYDRNSNRTAITHGIFKADSWLFGYDDLNRLTSAQREVPLTVGFAISAPAVGTEYEMDALGNLTAAAGGLKYNGAASTTVSHAVNATNEITSLSHSNPPGAPAAIYDTFNSILGTLWTTKTGTWASSSNKLNVSALDSGEAIILTDTELDTATYSFKVAFPTNSSTNKAGIVFCHDGDDDFVAVVLNRSTNKLELYNVSGGTWGSALADDNFTIADETEYSIQVTRRQQRVEAKIGSTASLACNLASDPGTGQTGFYSDKASVTFDLFTAYLADTRDPLATRIVGGSDTSLSSGTLLVEGGSEQAGLAMVEGFSSDDYTVLVDVNLNSGADAEVWFRQVDPENAYIVTLDSSGNITLDKLENGSRSTLDSDTYTPDTSVSVRIVADGTDLDVYVDGNQEINTSDGTFAAGGVAFAGEQPKFDNVQAGYDENADGDLADANDTKLVDEDFASGTASFTYCSAGNLVQDEKFTYTYDAWNRLVKVTARADSDVTIHTASYDGRGRRIKKTATNTGQHDGTVVFYYDGWKIIETRDGSGNMYQQFIHGTQYIDELVMMRVKDKGDLYVHQDANWNVIALTDLGGNVVERYTYTPYGQPTVQQVTSYGDRDGDGVVDSTDKGTPGTTCTGTVTGSCRIVDLDFDGDYDATDATLFDNLAQGQARHPDRTTTAVSFPFGHQGLYYDVELQSYQNRHRQYDAGARRFLQRDPVRQVAATHASLYDYLRYNPMITRDAYGLSPCDLEIGDCCEDVPDPEPAGFVCCQFKFIWWCVGMPIPECDHKICITEDPSRPPIIEECIRVHEQSHVDHSDCQVGVCGWGCDVVDYTPSQTVDECYAYRAEWFCLNRPETWDTTDQVVLDNCAFVKCMVDRLCHSQWPYQAAINACQGVEGVLGDCQ